MVGIAGRVPDGPEGSLIEEKPDGMAGRDNPDGRPDGMAGRETPDGRPDGIAGAENPEGRPDGTEKAGAENPEGRPDGSPPDGRENPEGTPDGREGKSPRDGNDPVGALPEGAVTVTVGKREMGRSRNKCQNAKGSRERGDLDRPSPL